MNSSNMLKLEGRANCTLCVIFAFFQTSHTFQMQLSNDICNAPPTSVPSHTLILFTNKADCSSLGGPHKPKLVRHLLCLFVQHTNSKVDNIVDTLEEISVLNV